MPKRCFPYLRLKIVFHNNFSVDSDSLTTNTVIMVSIEARMQNACKQFAAFFHYTICFA